MNNQLLISDLQQQESYAASLLQKFLLLSTLKRDSKVSDLELGAEIGYIQRLFEQYVSDMKDLNQELTSILEQINLEKGVDG